MLLQYTGQSDVFFPGVRACFFLATRHPATDATKALLYCLSSMCRSSHNLVKAMLYCTVNRFSVFIQFSGE